MIKANINRGLSRITSGIAFSFPPPAIPGVGTSGGVTFILQDRSGKDVAFLARNLQTFLAAARKRPELASVMTTALFGVPQVGIRVDRAKVLTQQVNLGNVYQTLQAFMGGSLVNYFNRFGRQWQVYVQADGEYRTDANNLGKFYVRIPRATMVPLSTVTGIEPRSGPGFTMRFNQFQSVQLNASTAPGYSSGQAIAALEDTFKQTMPSEMGFDYMGMSYQEKKAAQGVSPGTVFALAFFIVFLIMAAQYESWTLALRRFARNADRRVWSFPGALFPPAGERCLRADRTGDAHRPGSEERDSDRRIREDGIRQGQASGRGVACPAQAEIQADSDDRVRFHSRLRAAVGGIRSWRHFTPGARHRGHRWNAGRFLLAIFFIPVSFVVIERFGNGSPGRTPRPKSNTQ